jgi:hypothetical protein
MDGLPTELIRLCRLASMAECGDHLWASVPALGLWAAVWMPISRRWAGWRAAACEVLQNGQSENMQAGV